MLLLLLLQDSDDEVLVHLEDVLTPHPQDLADAEALGLTAQVLTYMYELCCQHII